jgi:hypothetical protein
MWFVVLDLVLLVLLTARVTRFFTSDSLGEWWVRDPAEKWALNNATYVGTTSDGEVYDTGWRGKLITGLECPFCIGFWIGAAAVLLLMAVGGPGDAPEWWRVFSGVFALIYLVGHMSGRLD